MVNRFAIVSVLLVVLVALPCSLASTDSLEAACADVGLWLSSAAPIAFLELVCTVTENGDPVALEFISDDENAFFEQNSDTEEYRLTIQKLELPEETKQQLLLLLILWSRQ